ncbi:MAG: hypothetical protein WBW33_04870 [Bryobacteraceae bacterium]
MSGTLCRFESTLATQPVALKTPESWSSVRKACATAATGTMLSAYRLTQDAYSVK